MYKLKIKLMLIPYKIDFHLVLWRKIRYKLWMMIHSRRLKRHFKRLNWSDKDVLDMTLMRCGSMNEAISVLSDELLDSYGKDRYNIRDVAIELVENGFENIWTQ